MIKATGNGQLFINTFGAIDTHTLAPGQTLIVDNFHLVAFSETCSYKVTKFGGLKETLLGGEGLVTQITGPGNSLSKNNTILPLFAILHSYPGIYWETLCDMFGHFSLRNCVRILKNDK